MPTKSTGGKTATRRKARHSWIQNFLNIKNFQNFILFLARLQVNPLDLLKNNILIILFLILNK